MKKEKKLLGAREYISTGLLSLTAIVLIGLLNHEVGWVLYAVGLAVTLLTKQGFRRYMLLLYGSLALLGMVPITTETTNENFFRMGLALTGAVALPYLVSRFVYHEKAVLLRFRMGRKWKKKELGYILFTAAVSYLLLPFYLRTSGAYVNWAVEPTTEGIIRLFIGTNALGIWDELFFVSTVLGILRLYFPFKAANFLQAILFTSFLHDLGFTGWGPLMIFPFALLQGYVFKVTDSLLYVITIHLTLDFVLFLALINANYPNLVDIFIT